MKIGSIILGSILVVMSVTLALIFYSKPLTGEWTVGYWFLTIILGLGGIVIAGIALDGVK